MGQAGRAIGVDFGTSTVLVATAQSGIVPIGEGGGTWMPSLVGRDASGAILAGEAAANLSATQNVRSIKRTITDRRQRVRLERPEGLREESADDLMVELLSEATRRCAQPLDRAFLGVPAMWDGEQRRRLVTIAGRVGLGVTLAGLVDEPVAAGIAWLSALPVAPASARVVVFDMGGGTLDVAVLDVHHNEVAVLAAVGLPEAGDVLDDALADDFEFELARHGVDVDTLANPGRARLRLAYAAPQAKAALSLEDVTDVSVPRAQFGLGSFPYAREQLEEAFAEQMERAELVVAAALRVAHFAARDPGTAHELARLPLAGLVGSVDVVLLSGGMCEIPYVTRRLRSLFPGARVELATRPPELAVVLGLARADTYGRVSMYRPAVDLHLDWADGSASVYDAFTPLVEAWQIETGSADLRHIRTGKDLALPPAATGRLRVVSHGAAPVRATLGGAPLDGFPVSIGPGFEFSIAPNGRLRLVDGIGVHEGQLTDWHTLG